jgi:DNA-binding response OmpR family regulator/Flp pilus assembly protein TadD
MIDTMATLRSSGELPRLSPGPVLAPPPSRKFSRASMRPLTNRPPGANQEPTILLVGADSAFGPALRMALLRHGVYVELAEPDAVAETAIATAPDLVVLAGEAAFEGGREILQALLASPVCSALPVAILDDNTALDERLSAFRHGAAAVIPRSASMDAIAEQIAKLAREIPNRGGEALGLVGEATLGEFVDALSKELRSGILSVHAGQEGNQEAVRLVLGSGRPLAAFIDEFVKQVQRHVVRAEPLQYEFAEHAGGTVTLLDPEAPNSRSEHAAVHGMRVALADNDTARADSVAQELRARGVTVVVTDLAPSEVRFLKLRQVDPEVLIIGDEHLKGPGYELLRRMRRDTRLRWPSLLVVRWEEIWSDSLSVPALDRLENALAPLAGADRALSERADLNEPFDARLEATGPARCLRALVGCPRALRVTVANPRLWVSIDLSDGLVVGASAESRPAADQHWDGPTALSALLMLSSGRVSVEPVSQPATTNLMATIDVALNMADSEPAPIAPSIPSHARISVRPPAGVAESSLEVAPAHTAALPSTEPARLQQPSQPPVSATSPAAALRSIRPSSRPPPLSRKGVSRRTAAVLVALAVLQGLVLVVLYNAFFSKRGQSAKDNQVSAASQRSRPTAVATSVPAAAGPVEALPAVAPSAAPSAEAEPAPAAASAATPSAETHAVSSAATTKLDESGISAPTCDALLSGEMIATADNSAAAATQVMVANRGLITGDLDSAERALCKAVHWQSTSAAIPLQLSQLLLLRRDGPGAVEWARQALERDPSNRAAQAALGDGLARTGENEPARTAWLISAGMSPGVADQVKAVARNSLREANVAFERHDSQRSERFFRRAAILDPGSLTAHVGLTSSLVRLGDLKSAALWAQRTVTIAPRDAGPRLALGDLLARQGDDVGAAVEWNEALRLDPANFGAKRRLARLDAKK